MQSLIPAPWKGHTQRFPTLFCVRWLPSNVQAERLKGGGALSIGGPRKRPELRPPSIPTPLQFTCRNRHFLVRKPFPCKAPEGGEEGTFMWPMTRILGWRRLPTLIRWLAASVILGFALPLRLHFGPLHEAARFLFFFSLFNIIFSLFCWGRGKEYFC